MWNPLNAFPVLRRYSFQSDHESEPKLINNFLPFLDYLEYVWVLSRWKENRFPKGCTGFLDYNTGRRTIPPLQYPFISEMMHTVSNT